MSDKKLKESWINQEDRGWSTESYQNYMKRRNQEEKALQKGTYEYEYETHDEMIRDSVKATDQQVGGNHYKGYAIQPIHFIMENDLGFCEGNILKYITRWKDKGGVEDLRKAKHYINMLIESALEKEK